MVPRLRIKWRSGHGNAGKIINVIIPPTERPLSWVPTGLGFGPQFMADRRMFIGFYIGPKVDCQCQTVIIFYRERRGRHFKKGRTLGRKYSDWRDLRKRWTGSRAQLRGPERTKKDLGLGRAGAGIYLLPIISRLWEMSVWLVIPRDGKIYHAALIPT